MLLLGFFWPRLKHSTLFGSEVLLWPWNLMGYGLDAEGGAAIATLSEGEHKLAWALLPLRGRARGVLRCLVFFIGGFLALSVLLVVLVEEAEVLGLILAPPTAAGGILVMVAFLAFFGDAWQSWSFHVLYLILASYGAINFKNSLGDDPGDRALALSSVAARALCLWFPLACLLTQSAQKDPFLEMVFAGGGGAINHIFSVI